jgi:hypothetical protein
MPGATFLNAASGGDLLHRSARTCRVHVVAVRLHLCPAILPFILHLSLVRHVTLLINFPQHDINLSHCGPSHANMMQMCEEEKLQIIDCGEDFNILITRYTSKQRQAHALHESRFHTAMEG